MTYFFFPVVWQLPFAIYLYNLKWENVTQPNLEGSSYTQYTAWKVSVFRVFLVRIFPYWVGMRENTDLKNSESRHFSCSNIYAHTLKTFTLIIYKVFKSYRVTLINVIKEMDTTRKSFLQICKHILHIIH